MRSAWLWAFLLAVLLAGLYTAWRFTPLSELLAPANVARYVAAVRETRWAPIVLILLYTPASLVMFPRPVLTLVAALAFGAWLGFAYAMAGTLLSAIACYGIGRLLPQHAVERLAGRHIEPVKKVLDRHGVLAVFALRVTPTAPHPVVSALAGTLRVRAWQFIVGSFFGMLPGVLATAVFGGELGGALQEAGKVNYWLAAGALAFFVATMWLLRRWLARQ